MNCKIYILLLLFLPLTNFAQSVWSGGPSGNWNNAANWSTGVVPSASNDVQFTSDVIVTLDINVSIKSLEVQGISGTDVVINAGAGTNLTIDGSDINDAALRLDEGNFELGSGVNLLIKNAFNHGILLDNMDTLTNNGTIYIQDFEGTIDENDDGIRANNSSVVINNGLLQIDDLNIEGGANSYAFYVNSGSTFINGTGATCQIVTPAMTGNVLNKHALLLNASSFVTNDGTISIGNGDNTRIEVYGIYNIASVFTNNGAITINGTSNIAIINDNAGATFTNNGLIDIDNADDGIQNQNDADVFINNNLIEIGNGTPELIDDYGIRNAGVFHNYANININGTRLQSLFNADANADFTNHSTGIITINNCLNVLLYNATSTISGLFTNDGGIIDLNQNTTFTGGSTGLLNDDLGTFINQNGGQITMDSLHNDGLRSDAIGTNALINSGAGSLINIGFLGPGSMGDGGSSDDAILAIGNIINEQGATINVARATGRLLFVDDNGNFTNRSGGIINLDNTPVDAISIEAQEGNKFLNTGIGSTINIGQTIGIGNGGTTDNAIQNRGNFENLDGATINIDKVKNGYAIEVGNGLQRDTFINSGIINITQNGDTIQQSRVIWVRDTSVLHNLAGGEINMSNVMDYAMEFEAQSELINNGTIHISDYEMFPSGADNAILLQDANWENDGTIRINDPNETGFFFAHAISANNCTVDLGSNSNIIIADANMTTGNIGGTALYFNNCSISNAGTIQIGNGQSNRIEANGIHCVNSPFINTATANIIINGLAVNTNGILVTGGNFSNQGNIHINNAFRGIYSSSSSAFFNNSGAIHIGDGNPTNMGSFGLFNQTAYTNSGTININGTTSDGIRTAHPLASFFNTSSGTINIDNSNANGLTNGFGSNNPCPFTNDGGDINIGQNGTANSIANIALFNDDAGSLTNTNGGIINLSNANIQALQNEANANNQILNTACSIINIDGNLRNDGTFNNEAILTINNGNYTSMVNLNNTGYIEDNAAAFVIADRNLGTVTGLNNTGTLMSQLSMLCSTMNANDALVSETSNLNNLDFSTTSNWYFDANLSSVAGLFDSSSNTFTFNTTPSIGINTLYFDIDGTNGCSFTGKIEINVQADASCGNCPTNISVSGSPQNMETINASNTISTNGLVTIQSTNTVHFKAGISICIEPEFEVELGAEFEAIIEDCLTPLTENNSNQ